MRIYMCGCKCTNKHTQHINLCVYNILYTYMHILDPQACLCGLSKARLRKINAAFPFHH